jgi:hypothetical protein
VSESGFAGHGGAGVPARDGVPSGLPDALEFGPGGLAVIYAEQNTRESLFAAMRRRETYATSGTRPRLRFFAGWDYPKNLCEDPQMLRAAYAGGVPMGGELQAPADRGVAPVFLAAASRDVLEGGPLQQIQIVKGWIDAEGASRERVVSVARAPGAPASVDELGCGSTGEGADSLCAVWSDDEYGAEGTGWYYARVLENPSCRWSARMCAAGGVRCDDPATVTEGFEGCCSADHRPVIQERAWSSPIWVLPPTGGVDG